MQKFDSNISVKSWPRYQFARVPSGERRYSFRDGSDAWKELLVPQIIDGKTVAPVINRAQTSPASRND